MKGRLLVGTSGFVYRHWRGRFYPAALPARAWLDFYAARFPTVELNTPFYRLPSGRAFAAWRDAAPPGFVFAVKASRYLTHVTRLRSPAAPLRRFLLRARHLGPALGPVLFQLPASFHADPGRLDRLLGALARQRVVRGVRAAFEVRHASWLDPAVQARLTRANVALCLHDWRECPVRDGITADFVYLRRHGAARRYAGSYSRRQLAADAARIRAWLRQGRDVYVYFNNDDRACAVRNARTLIDLVRGPAARPRPRRPGSPG
jgi:uncharacterized protein YecE (DUF72 family)